MNKRTRVKYNGLGISQESIDYKWQEANSNLLKQKWKCIGSYIWIKTFCLLLFLRTAFLLLASCSGRFHICGGEGGSCHLQNYITLEVKRLLSKGNIFSISFRQKKKKAAYDSHWLSVGQMFTLGAGGWVSPILVTWTEREGRFPKRVGTRQITNR